MKDMYFKTKDGVYHPEFMAKNAFYLVTGMKADENPENYEKWLCEIWGKAIVSKCEADNIQITSELYQHQRLLCCKLYRETHKCTLSEAKEFLDAKYGKENGET